jgi:rRNA maturation RNase YbeY|tara:strand:+ start:989 stop:1399 length:411 start_codon:yes stop_codon:yes gene_type:complete
MISFQIQAKYRLANRRKIKIWLNNIIKEEGAKTGTITYLLINDKEMLVYNQQFLQHDTFTDVITFENKDVNNISGDIVISIERIYENAEKYKVVFAKELYRVMAHGLLHLLGYNDKSNKEAKEIRKKENYYLEKMA